MEQYATFVDWETLDFHSHSYAYHGGEHFVMYIIVELLCCTSESNMLCINYIPQ